MTKEIDKILELLRNYTPEVRDELNCQVDCLTHNRGEYCGVSICSRMFYRFKGEDQFEINWPVSNVPNYAESIDAQAGLLGEGWVLNVNAMSPWCAEKRYYRADAYDYTFKEKAHKADSFIDVYSGCAPTEALARLYAILLTKKENR